MKQLYIILCILLSFSSNLSAQALNCSDSYLSPFCSGIAQYPANFDGTGPGSGPQAPAGPNYDCLFLQPNPTYFSITIGQGGTIDFTLMNSANSDIDFILWGPFAGIAAAQAACDSMGQGGVWGGVTDCSYLPSGIEPVSIPNALPGEVYILMITNFANTATNIFSTQSTGTGNISCPCDIPYLIDTMPTAFGNQGYLADTSNGVAQFVVCPNQTLGIQVEALAAINDTLTLYGPFSTINSVFSNNTVFAFNPTAPTSYDSLTIFTLLTPDMSHIGLNSFNIGMKNDLYTGGLVDSSCFDIINVQVIVPGVQLTDKNVCSGEVFQILTDSVPSTPLGSSSYTWTQIAGPTIGFSSTTARQPTITIPRWNATNSADSVVITVDYSYGGLCPMKDTMVLRFSNISLSINATPDSICIGQSSNLMVLLSDTLTSPLCDDYTVTNIPFAPLLMVGTNVATFTPLELFLPASDEGISAGFPIGFNFNFYCNNYNTFYIHTNGFITFTPIAPGAGLLSGTPIPFAAIPNNLIALGWEDLDVSLGGSIRYYMQGVAPNRKLIVSFIGIRNFLGATQLTAQTILYESDNSIEIHITNNSLGVSTVGLENANGTDAHHPAVLPQGQTAGTLTNIAYRFKPTSLGPFYTWLPSNSLSNNAIHNPIANPTVPTTYSVNITEGPCVYTDTTRIDIIPAVATPTISCDSAGLTSISFSWSDISLSGAGFYEYSLDGGMTWTNVGTALSATATGLAVNMSYSILIRANDGSGSPCSISPATSTICTTLNPACAGNPPIGVSLASTALLCNSDSTACLNAIITGGSGNPMLLSWSNGEVNMDSICNLAAGNYSLTVADTMSISTGIPGIYTLYQQAFDGVHDWTLNIPTGLNATTPNVWLVNDSESGVAPPGCGTGGTGNQSLYITCTSTASCGTSIGAVFNATRTSNVRAESPGFSTIGSYNLTLKFNYIANGNALLDNASLWYKDGLNGWQVLDPSLKTPVCGGGAGRWTAYSIALPASCHNRPAVRIGFNWTNNSDNIGSDPSVAIDSVVVSTINTGSILLSCIASANTTITEPMPLNIVLDSVYQPFCNSIDSGAIYISANGGTGTYSYSWSNSMTTQDIANLPNDDYILTITDINGCSDTVQVTITAGVILNSTNSITNASCFGENGAATISVLGGTGVYNFNWGASSSVTTNTATLPAGTYITTFTDTGNGCTGQDTVSITAPLALSLYMSGTDIGCSDSSNAGAINLNVTGGTGAYLYNWDIGANSQNLTGLTAGSYTVTVTDGNGCTATNFAFPIVQTDTISINITTLIGHLSCDLQPIGALIATALGGTNITYAWSNGTTTPDLDSLTSGTYTVTATNSDGCTATASQNILAPIVPTVDAYVNAAGTTSIAIPENSAAVTISAGSTGFNYNWTGIADPISNNPNISNNTTATTTANPTTKGIYTYIVVATATTNDTICTATDTVWITVEAPFKGIPTAFSPDSDGQNDTFRPLTLSDEAITTFRVYNRWGQEVYNGDGVHGNGWDGTYLGVEQSSDVYLYLIVFQKANATAPTTIRGEVTLLR